MKKVHPKGCSGACIAYLHTRLLPKSPLLETEFYSIREDYLARTNRDGTDEEGQRLGPDYIVETIQSLGLSATLVSVNEGQRPSTSDLWKLAQKTECFIFVQTFPNGNGIAHAVVVVDQNESSVTYWDPDTDNLMDSKDLEEFEHSRIWVVDGRPSWAILVGPKFG